MNYYHNEIEVYNRYLEKRKDLEENQFVVEGVLERVEMRMKYRGIDYEDIIKEQEIIKEFFAERVRSKDMEIDEYYKKYNVEKIIFK